MNKNSSFIKEEQIFLKITKEILQNKLLKKLVYSQ